MRRSYPHVRPQSTSIYAFVLIHVLTCLEYFNMILSLRPSPYILKTRQMIQWCLFATKKWHVSQRLSRMIPCLRLHCGPWWLWTL